MIQRHECAPNRKDLTPMSIFSRPCSHPSCPNTTRDQYCEDHIHLKKENSYLANTSRASASRRGYGNRWRRYRYFYLSQHPYCAHCFSQGRVVPATVVDHIEPHKGSYELFWKEGNHQGLCEKCHNRKTATEDSSWWNTNDGLQ